MLSEKIEPRSKIMCNVYNTVLAQRSFASIPGPYFAFLYLGNEYNRQDGVDLQGSWTLLVIKSYGFGIAKKNTLLNFQHLRYKTNPPPFFLSF